MSAAALPLLSLFCSGYLGCSSFPLPLFSSSEYVPILCPPCLHASMPAIFVHPCRQPCHYTYQEAGLCYSVVFNRATPSRVSCIWKKRRGGERKQQKRSRKRREEEERVDRTKHAVNITRSYEVERIWRYKHPDIAPSDPCCVHCESNINQKSQSTVLLCTCKQYS